MRGVKAHLWVIYPSAELVVGHQCDCKEKPLNESRNRGGTGSSHHGGSWWGSDRTQVNHQIVLVKVLLLLFCYELFHGLWETKGWWFGISRVVILYAKKSAVYCCMIPKNSAWKVFEALQRVSFTRCLHASVLNDVTLLGRCIQSWLRALKIAHAALFCGSYSHFQDVPCFMFLLIAMDFRASFIGCF